MKSKNKGVVSTKDNSLNELEIGIFTSNLNFVPCKNQTYFCSFCKQELIDDSILFRDISVCPICLSLWSKLVLNLLEYNKEREAKHGIK
jgi:hypothetical protein